MLGHTKEEIAGLTVADLVHEELAKINSRVLWQVFLEKYPYLIQIQ